MHRVALAGLLAVVACKDKPPSQPPPLAGSAAAQEHDAAPPTPPTRVRVALLDSGAEPRERLRYALNVGDKQTVVLRLRYTAQNRLQASPPATLVFPTMKLVFQVEVVEALVGDRVRYRFELGEAALTEVGGVAPTILAMAGDALNSARGIRGSATVDSRGVITAGDIELPDKLDPGMRLMVESMRNSMEQLATPLPEDPVGIGARWEASQTMTQGDTTIDHSILFELAASARGKRELRGTIEQRAPRQDVAVDSAEDVELLSLDAKGTATVELNLERLAPSRALYRINSESRFEVTTEGRRRGLITKGNVDITVSAQ